MQLIIKSIVTKQVTGTIMTKTITILTTTEPLILTTVIIVKVKIMKNTEIATSK